MFTLHIDGAEDVAAEVAHASTARKLARRMAEGADTPIEVRVQGRPRFIIRPGGEAAAPEGVVIPERARHNPEAAACFCYRCRAARRA